MKNRILSLLIVSVMLFRLLSVTVFAGELIMQDDYEKYPIGSAVVKNDSVYLNGSTEWTSLPDGCTVEIEEITKEKYLQISNNSNLTQRFVLSKALQTSGEACNFSIKFSLNNKGNPFNIALYEYGKLTRDVLINLTSDGKVQLYDEINGYIDVCEYGVNSWNDFLIEADVESNVMGVYMNNTLIYTKNIYIDPPQPHILRNFEFNFDLGAKQCVMLDDTIIEKLDIVRETTNGLSFSLNETRMNELSGVHPRILATQDKFDSLKKTIESQENEYINKLYSLVKYAADSRLDFTVPEFINSGENLDTSTYGLYIVPMAFMYKMTGEKKYLDKAWEITYALNEYPQWGENEDAFSGLGAKGAFWGTSLFYDWCYHDLTDDRKFYIIMSLAEKGASMNGGAWWSAAYMQNHSVHGRGSALMAALAIYDEYPDAKNWIYNSLSKLKYTIELWPEDGTGYEGNLYASNALGDLVTVLAATEDICGIKALEYPTLEASLDYALYNTVSRDFWSITLDQFYFGDATPYSGGAMIRFVTPLATRLKNPVAQWYVQEMIEEKSENNAINDEIDVFALLFYDKDLAALTPEEFNRENGDDLYPTNKILSDTGYVYLRENWSGSEDIIAFRCGYLMGEKVADFAPTYAYDLGAGHQHADVTHFEIVSNGEWLFSDDGYTYGWSKNHSVPLINGIGQLGDYSDTEGMAKMGLSDNIALLKAWTTAAPKIIKSEFRDDLSYVVADSTALYFPDKNELNKVYRHFIYSKPQKTLIIIDEFDGNKENTFETRLRPTVQTPSALSDGSFYYAGGNTEMIIKPFADKDAKVKNETEILVAGKSGGTVPAKILSVSKTDNKWLIPIAISWQDKGITPLNVEMNETENGYAFSFGTREVAVDVLNQTIASYDSQSDYNVKVNGKLIKYDNAPVMKNGTILVDLEETLQNTGYTGEYSADSNEYIAEIKGEKISFRLNSDKLICNGNELTFAEPAELINDKLYVPVRMISSATDEAVYYDQITRCAVIDGSIDVKDAGLFEMAVNGQTVLADSDGVYRHSMYGTELFITPSANSKAANVRIEKSETVFGSSKVYITSADGKNTNMYTVETQPQKNIGTLPIHNIVTEDATQVDIAATLDNDLSTSWAADGRDIDIVYDFGSTAMIEDVLIAFNQGHTRKQLLTIMVSDDNENFRTVFDGKSSGTTNEAEKFTINSKARYVKLIFNGHTNGGGWNNNSEIGFNGYY